MSVVHQAKPHHVLVAIVTTAGIFPGEGFDEVPDHQPVLVQLERAARALGITNTTGWIATVGSRELAIDKSYVDQDLSGRIEINYSPRETGGGGA